MIRWTDKHYAWVIRTSSLWNMLENSDCSTLKGEHDVWLLFPPTICFSDFALFLGVMSALSHVGVAINKAIWQVTSVENSWESQAAGPGGQAHWLEFLSVGETRDVVRTTLWWFVILFFLKPVSFLLGTLESVWGGWVWQTWSNAEEAVWKRQDLSSTSWTSVYLCSLWCVHSFLVMTGVH